MRSICLICSILFFMQYDLYAQVQVGQDLNGTSQDNYFGTFVSMAENGQIVAVLSRRDQESRQIHIYREESDIWTSYGTDEAGGHFEALSVTAMGLSADGSTLAYGAGNQITVLQYDNGVWVSKGQLIDDGMTDDGYIIRLTPNGNTFAIADSNISEVFRFQDNEWVNIGRLEIESPLTSVDISDDATTVAISNNLQTSVFKNNGGTWQLKGEPIEGFSGNWGPVDGLTQGSFKTSRLSADGNIVAISEGYFEDGNPMDRTRVYQFQSSNWNKLGSDLSHVELPTVAARPDIDLSANGKILAIGLYAPYDPTADKIYIYQYINNAWEKRSSFSAGLTENSGTPSVSLSANASRIAIGDYNNDEIASNAGKVRVFEIGSTLSIDEVNIKEIKLFPNPSSDIIKLEIPAGIEIQQFNILNSLGQKLMISTSSTLNVSSFSTGHYLAQIVTNNGTIYKKIVIK